MRKLAFAALLYALAVVLLARQDPILIIGFAYCLCRVRRLRRALTAARRARKAALAEEESRAMSIAYWLGKESA